MSGQWANSDRRARLPADWHKLRAATYRQAGGRCQHLDTDGTRCPTITPLHKTGDTPGGHADHVVAMTDGPELQWLCPYHHGRKSSREGNAARPREQRPTEQHPGLA